MYYNTYLYSLRHKLRIKPNFFVANSAIADPEQLSFTNWATTSPTGKGDCITVAVGEVIEPPLVPLAMWLYNHSLKEVIEPPLVPLLRGLYNVAVGEVIEPPLVPQAKGLYYRRCRGGKRTTTSPSGKGVVLP